MKKGLLALILVSTMTALLGGWNLTAGAPGHREMAATVESLYCAVASFTTEEGNKQSVALGQIKREEVPYLEEGDRVFLELNEGNQVVEIHAPDRHGALLHRVGTVLRRIKS